MTDVITEPSEDEVLGRRSKRRKIVFSVGALVLFTGTIVASFNPGSNAHAGEAQAKASCVQLENLINGIGPANLAFINANAAANASGHYATFFTAVQHVDTAENTGDISKFTDADRSVLSSVCGAKLPDVLSIIRDHGQSVASTDYIQLALQLNNPDGAELSKVVADSDALAAAQRNGASKSTVATDESTFEADLSSLGQLLQSALATLESEELLVTYWRADEDTLATDLGLVQADCVKAANQGANIPGLNADLAQFANDLTAERAAAQKLRKEMAVAPLSTGFL